MKKIQLIFVLGFLALSFTGFSQIKVNSSGQVGINNTNPSYRLDLSGNLRVANGSMYIFLDNGQAYSSGGTSWLGTYSYPWTNLFVNNAIFWSNPTIYSDQSLKTDIREIKDVRNSINLLRPVKYKMKDLGDGKDYTKDQIGFIAQEIQQVFPELVEEIDNGLLGVKYSELIPVLVQAIKEQQAEIEGLKFRIEKLEADKK